MESRQGKGRAGTSAQHLCFQRDRQASRTGGQHPLGTRQGPLPTPTLQPPEIGGVQGSHGSRDPGGPADTCTVDGPHTEQVGPTLNEARHGVLADLYWRVIALHPAVGPHLTPWKAKPEGKRKWQGLPEGSTGHPCVPVRGRCPHWGVHTARILTLQTVG